MVILNAVTIDPSGFTPYGGHIPDAVDFAFPEPVDNVILGDAPRPGV